MNYIHGTVVALSALHALDIVQKCSASSIEENSHKFEGIWRHTIYEVIELESEEARYNAHIQQKRYFIPSPDFEYFFANPRNEGRHTTPRDSYN